MKDVLFLFALVLFTASVSALPSSIPNTPIGINSSDVQYLRGRGFTAVEVSPLSCTDVLCIGEVSLKKGRQYHQTEQLVFSVFDEMTGLEFAQARNAVIKEYLKGKIMYFKLIEFHQQNKRNITQTYSNGSVAY